MFCSRGRDWLFLVILAISAANAQPGDPPGNFSTTSKELIGIWFGEGEVIEFRNDGKCRYGSEVFPYELSQGHILIETGAGKVIFAYSIRSGKLILTADGQQSVYSKQTGSPRKSPVVADGRIPADLFGKWCYLKSSSGSYSGRCITLRSDGTYLYEEESSRSVQTDELAGGTASSDSDSGTWYVEGDRLHYKSEKEGNGSFKLERRNHPVNQNDPMIVLDDEPFVTTARRAPWR